MPTSERSSSLSESVLRNRTIQFLKAIGFEYNDRIWIKLSWDLPTQLAPKWWPRYQRQAEHLRHLVYCGIITKTGFTLHPCLLRKKSKQEKTQWRPLRIYKRDGWKFCFKQSLQGATVCFYPNKPKSGIANSNVKKCHCIFYEIDNVDLDKQEALLKNLTQRTQLKPTAVVFSGGKSLHVYLKSSQTIDPQDWIRLNRKLCIVQNGDPQICNPARAMRLPGMMRRKLTKTETETAPKPSVTPIELKLCKPDRAYNPHQLELCLNSTGLFPLGLDDARWRDWTKMRNQGIDDANQTLTKKRETAKVPASQFPVRPTPLRSAYPRSRGSDAIPLSLCLTRDDQCLIQTGMAEGNRNSAGFKLARNLLGTTQFLQSINQPFSSKPRELFDQYCDRCYPPVNPIEAERIWQSAESSPATPSRSPESIAKTIAYYQYSHRPKLKTRRA
jgi:hypothetical protein